ncbi:hypothetical protein Vadar_013434 [Vaccinium darrowii]|uniref:Uncharacterized protein n=1 Tax=Vaccinium darrowii TaxID=229202 RepID=A0ACB7ZK57_9ERIC|nr:hypothetical protein Vadar_013434 [Vaccinium darrowii]
MSRARAKAKMDASRSNTIDIDNNLKIDDDPILGNNEEDEPENTGAKPKNSSFLWDHFTRLPEPKVPPPGYKQKATCNYCGTEFACNSDHNGTSSMRTHLVRRCKQYELSDAYMKKHGGDKRQKILGFEPVGPGDTVPKLTVVGFRRDKKVYNWYEKRTLEHEETEASNVETSKNKEKNGKQSMDLSEALDSEFDQHMEEETNMMKDGVAGNCCCVAAHLVATVVPT